MKGHQKHQKKPKKYQILEYIPTLEYIQIFGDDPLNNIDQDANVRYEKFET